jgi:hypothetical protein
MVSMAEVRRVSGLKPLIMPILGLLSPAKHRLAVGHSA